MVRKNFIYCSTNSGGGGYWLPEVTITAYSEALDPTLIWESNSGNNVGGMFGPISISGTRKYWQNMTMGGGGGGIDWSGVVNATISMAGGAAEMAVAGGIEYFSIGLATPASGALMLDGSARVFANMQRLYYYLNGNPAFGNAYPTSLGGIVGKGLDMAFGVPADKIGFGQAIGSWGNEIVSFSMVGGNGLALFDFYESPSLETGIKYGLSFINYPYSLYFDKPTK